MSGISVKRLMARGVSGLLALTMAAAYGAASNAVTL